MSRHIVFTVAILTTLGVFCCFGQDQVRMTLLSYNHFKSEQDSHYQCRMSGPDDDPGEASVESLRTGWTRNTKGENPDPPDAYYKTKSSHPYYRVEMYNNGNNDAFGVFGCKATQDGKKETIISTTRMRSDAYIVPSDGLFTQTVSIGDRNVTISMVNTTEETPVSHFEWISNLFYWGFQNGTDSFKIDGPVLLHHAGIYECYGSGDRASAQHGLNLLLVRACPSTRWGPPYCMGVCDSCYNGGICDENTGQCVCAPGFPGKNCLKVCGGNRFGYDCELRCTYTGNDPKYRCGGILYCLVHPFGCRCNTGFRGLDCDTECDENTFGASCLQTCHCSSDRCNRYTGECEGTDTSCDPGWTGDFCQECVNGYFGQECDQECHRSSEKCNRESGLCQTGGCLLQWADLFPPYSCQTGLKNAPNVRVNPNVTVPVNCTAVQGPGGNLTSLDVVLSRSMNKFNDTNIVLEETFLTDTSVAKLFTVWFVDRDIELYCQLLDTNEVRVAVLTVNVDFYELPALTNAPIKGTTTESSVTIRWSAWDADTDVGDPPIVGYIPYYRKQGDDIWIPGSQVSIIDRFQFTFNDLESDTEYSFSVAAVREGEGKGPRSPSLDVNTICVVPPSPENVVTNILGERQQLVKISWEFPSKRIGCRSGVTKFTVYYYSSKTEKTSHDVTDPNATSIILSNLTAGIPYTFFVTLSTSDVESEDSNEGKNIVPVLPSFVDAPSLSRITCNSVTMTWRRWSESKDTGTPPLLHYIPYHRLHGSFGWVSSGIVKHSDAVEEYNFTFHDLMADSAYEFCVTVVREGVGGEGDKINIVKQNTAYCSINPEKDSSQVPTYAVFSTLIFAAITLTIIMLICLTRWHKDGGTLTHTYAAEGPAGVKYGNPGFGYSHDYASINYDFVKNYENGQQDISPEQNNETTIGGNTDFSGYEIPTNNTRSTSSRQCENMTGGEDNSYEIPTE